MVSYAHQNLTAPMEPRRNLRKQVKRYTTALGPGAVVFAGGASEKVRSALKRLGVAALDGSKLTTDGWLIYLISEFFTVFWGVQNQYK